MLYALMQVSLDQVRCSRNAPGSGETSGHTRAPSAIVLAARTAQRDPLPDRERNAGSSHREAGQGISPASASDIAPQQFASTITMSGCTCSIAACRLHFVPSSPELLNRCEADVAQCQHVCLATQADSQFVNKPL